MAAGSQKPHQARVLVWTYLRRENERETLRGVIEYAQIHTRWQLNHWTGICDATRGAQAAAFDGILLGTIPADGASLLPERRTVLLDSTRSELGLPIVRPDYKALADRIFEEIAALGHRRVLFAGPDQNWSHLRRRPLAALCRREGLEYTHLEVPVEAALQEQQIQTLRKHPRPFLVVTPNAVYAHLLVDGAEAAGLAIPEEMSLLAIGTDEIEANLCHPTLTTVDHNSHGIGYLAAELLDTMLQGKRPRRKLHLVGPGRAELRGSTDYVFDDQQLVQALRFIRDHAVSGIRVEDVMAPLIISRRALEQRIRKHLGRTIHEEIMRVRLDAAMEMLIGTLEPLADVAAGTGFQSASDLCKIFKRRVGITPSAFRRKAARSSGKPAGQRG
jgi:LacI family transcriptional regulator